MAKYNKVAKENKCLKTEVRSLGLRLYENCRKGRSHNDRRDLTAQDYLNDHKIRFFVVSTFTLITVVWVLDGISIVKV